MVRLAAIQIYYISRVLERRGCISEAYQIFQVTTVLSLT